MTMEKRSRFLASIVQCFMYLNIFGASCQGSFQSQYIGCFYDTSSQANWTVRVQDSNEMTVDVCIQRCKENITTIAILQSGRNCLCGDILDVSFPNNTCNLPCSGNAAQVCGGNDKAMTLSVIYTACPVGYYGTGCNHVCHCKRNMPCYRFSGKCPNGCESSWSGETCNKESNISDRYLGCYADGQAPDPRAMDLETLKDLGQTNTIEVCSEYCTSKGYMYTYAGLQYSYVCFCGESYDRYGTATICNMACSGNQTQACGGAYANSVYSVCPNGTYGEKCVARCNCLNNTICTYGNGSCRSLCAPGWSGSSCSNRDCSVNNGACYANESCVTVAPNISSAFRCQCSAGYQRIRLWDNCTDINECDAGICDSSTTNCTNTVGSFSCNCLTGYKNLTSTTCQDIDECAGDPEICSSSLKMCLNTVGNYKCDCRPGYAINVNNECDDVDECKSMTHNCSNTTDDCSNTPGSFVCNCKTGFQKQQEAGSNICAVSGPAGPSPKAGTIAGAVVGSILGLTLIVVIVLLLIYCIRRKSKKSSGQSEPKSSASEILDTQRKGRVVTMYVATYEEIGPTSGDSLKTLHTKLSDLDGIKQEFQSVDLKTGNFCALGTRDEVKKKNRFINIIPYESNRVVLSRTTDEDTSQYINASFVEGYNGKTKFIATQGPREETVEDFWRMIIEHHVHLIVMITKLVENNKSKCEKYWPELGHPVVYGNITVTLKSEDSWPDYTVRCLHCSQKSETVELKQFHYLSWPDHGVPSDVKGFLTFRRIVRQQMKPVKNTVVHCSAGAGRTGAFIGIDYLIEQEKAERDVKILDCLKKLRGQRSQMIQNLAQYEFVHKALLLAFEIGDTVIPVPQFLSKYKELQTKDQASGESILEKQFKSLENKTMNQEETAKFRAWSSVVAQNRMDDMSAVFVQSWKLQDAYIAVRPVDSLMSLWELREEQSCAVIIFLDPNRGSGALFFPTKDNPISLSDLTMICESTTKEEYGSRYIISEFRENEESAYSNVDASGIYQNAGSTSEKTQITVLHVTESLGKGSSNADSLMSLYDVVMNATPKKSKVPVMVVSSDFSLSGFYLAAFNAFEMMKQEQMIDVYQIVQNIRKSNTELFNSMSSYNDLHNVVERYVVASNA